MSEYTPLKHYFDEKMVLNLADRLKSVYDDFDSGGFAKQVMGELEELELKARVAHIATAYHDFLPKPYPKALDCLLATLSGPLADDRDLTNSGFQFWPIAHFIEVYGHEHLDASVRGLYEVTQRFTGEWAIRPYLLRYQDVLEPILHQWAVDKSMHVRRLVSEGTRTRLPWGIRLHPFIQDPAPVIALLEKLKDDPELYVRRSVANNLNDLTKDHPEMVLDLLEGWKKGASEERMWLIRHALRSLIKAGDSRALAILGFGGAEVEVKQFTADPTVLQLGETVQLDIELVSKSAEPQRLMIDYIIHLVKANGSTFAKVFKLTQKTLPPNGTLAFQKRQSIRPISTRKYYRGTHKVSLQVNGKIIAETAFELEV